MVNNRWLWIVLFSLVPAMSWAQPIRGSQGMGTLTFLEDSVWVGYPTPVALSFTYPEDWQVLMPDSSANFTPFNFRRYEYFPTRTVDGRSRDSAVYYVTTFEVDEQQYLNLPVMAFTETDTATFWVGADSIGLWDVVPALVDSLQLVQGELTIMVDPEYNSPYLIAGSVFAFILVGVLVVLFVTPIRRWWKRRRLQRSHEQWLVELDRLSAGLSGGQGQGEVPEQWMNLWKKYLEGLEGKPYTKMTTRELAQFPEVKDYRDILREFDRAIYGQRVTPDLPTGAEKLRGYAVKRYEERLQHLEA